MATKKIYKSDNLINNKIPIPCQLDHDFLPDPKNPYQKIFTNLQANIIKGHGRAFTAIIFLEFLPDRRGRSQLTKIKSQIRKFSEKVTSTKQQLEEISHFRKNQIKGDLIINFFLSASGYSFLKKKCPSDKKFMSGMQGSNKYLNDPPADTWESPYQQTPLTDGVKGPSIHAGILLADESKEKIEDAIMEVSKTIIKVNDQELARVLTIERGHVIRNSDGHAIEHFGYVDGISQPLFLQDDLLKESKKAGISTDSLLKELKKSSSASKKAKIWEKFFTQLEWNPFAPLNLVLTPDPNTKQSDPSFGSYLVFRKLEQNVKGFIDHREDLAQKLALSNQEKERAGALIMGRFPDGTPLTEFPESGAFPYLRYPNNYNYDSDSEGAKCPFHAHIRKSNTRTNGHKIAKNKGRIVRRGMTYDQRGKYGSNVRYQNPQETSSFDDLPTIDVGLLFLCYQSDIKEQFEEIQSKIANNINFPEINTGIDPLIGNNDTIVNQSWPIEWDKAKTRKHFLGDLVTLKGGEYFFAPSISFLKNIR